MKRLLTVLFLTLSLLALAACGSAPAADPAEQEPASAQQAEELTPAPAEEPEPPAEEPEAPEDSPEQPAEETQPAPAQPAAPADSQPASQPEDSSQPPENAILHVYGDGVTQESWFTMEQLQDMSSGYVDAEYYYRGKDPEQGHSHCQGVKLAYVLEQSGLSDSAAKVTLRAGDGYAMSYTLSNVRKAYVDETDLSKSLYMILAWVTDGESTGNLTLVMGQNLEGEYNRTYWVKDVIEAEVSL